LEGGGKEDIERFDKAVVSLNRQFGKRLMTVTARKALKYKCRGPESNQ
jgi:hypothetical protein